jgi:hypothetical protein
MQSVMTAEAPIASGTVMPLIGGGYLLARQQPPNAWVLQRHGADGQPAGAEVTLVAPTDASASIAPLAGGGYAAVWLELAQFQRFGGSIYKLLSQSFTATGAPIGSPQQVAETIPALYWIPRPIAMPQVAALTGGGYAVVWGQGNGAGGLAIVVRRFSADGTSAGAAQQAAPEGSGYLGVTGVASGGFLVTWGTFGVPEGSARAYGPDGAPLGPAQAAGPSWSDFPVNGGEPPMVAPLAGGGAVMVWLRDTLPYVRVQQLAPNAAPLASPSSVDDSTPVAPEHNGPAVAGLPDGGYVVAWIEAGEVHARRFAADGAALGEETRINLATTAVQAPVDVIARVDGGFMISWSGVDADGVRKNHARVFPRGGLLPAP